MKKQPSIETPRLLLRPLVLSDAQDIQKLAGHPKVAATTRYIPHPYPDGYAEAWINTLQPNYDQNIQMIYGIVVQETNELVGSIGYDFHHEHSSASIGFWFGPDHWGKGYATEAAKALMNYGFKVLNLNRIQAYCLKRNLASAKVLQKLGMTHEASERQSLCIRGTLEDIERFAILKTDPRP